MIFKRKEKETVHIDFNTRPIVAFCECGKPLRGRDGRLPADRMYFIGGRLTCRRCSLRWLDQRYEITEVM